jgi:hypothetical protein
MISIGLQGRGGFEGEEATMAVGTLELSKNSKLKIENQPVLAGLCTHRQKTSNTS